MILIASLAATGASAQTSAQVGLTGYDSLSATPGTASSATLPATTNNYYVSPTGSDTAAGTKAAPFKTLVFKNAIYNWQLRNGLTHTGTLTTEPLLAGYPRTAALPNFKPSTSSPVVGRGIARFAHPTDIDGKPRNTTTGFDVGASQH